MRLPFRQRHPASRRLMIIANVSLAAGLSLWIFVPRSLAKSHLWLDFLGGLFIGVSLAANLLALRRARRCGAKQTPHP